MEEHVCLPNIIDKNLKSHYDKERMQREKASRHGEEG